jgi:peptidyl-dipeptidase A
MGSKKMKSLLQMTVWVIFFFMTSCNSGTGTGTSTPVNDQQVLTDAGNFIAEHETTVRPLEIAGNRAWWAAYTSGRDDDFKAKEEAQNRLDAALSNKSRFEQLEKIRSGLKGAAANIQPEIAREIDVLYLQYLEKQVDPELLQKISAKTSAVEKTSNNYRLKIDGKEMSDSQMRKVLKDSNDGAYRKAVWEASKAIGPAVEKDLKELVAFRNEAARKLGYKDYHALQLALNEQDQAAVLKLFDELDTLIHDPFIAAKTEIDAQLAKKFGITAAELRPWHYGDPFFQEAPDVGGRSFDPIYAKLDVIKLARDFYQGIGLPVDTILARSDLYEKPGKSPHAYSTDIDRDGDVRVLANVVPNEYWAGTMIHELGHGVYSLNLPRSLPYVLRIEAHPLTTEGIAMLFEGFASNTGWLEAMGVSVPERKALEETATRKARYTLLVFAAWAQVMYRFEMALYENPEQDLNRLWWDLVERYQEIHRPDGRNVPDYGAKVHFVSSPCYYHNYLMGQLFASQVHHAIARDVLKTDPAKALYNGRKEVGEFLKTKVFGPGRSLDWNGLARHATGEPLNAKAFAEDLKMR